MRWSVFVEAAGDRPVTLDEVVELADAVAPVHGIASGAGTPGYSARIVVEAEDHVDAEERAAALFTDAAQAAGLPVWPVTTVSALSEAEDDEVGYEM